MNRTIEYNFDGIVGPTHNYAGLSPGNLASQKNRSAVSHPRAAALEGLAKMRLLHDLGVPQAVLPPHERPHVPTLRRLGFTGGDAQVIETAARSAPELLAACSSASAMWAANAATVSPSADTADGRVHFTPANLCGLLHRSIEAPTTSRILRAIFSDERHFAHHDPLPATAACGDEGAANHMRFANGLEVFVFGRDHAGVTTRFPARQTRQASEAIARLHGLDPQRTIYLKQNPIAIDAGAFHNDVVAVAHQSVLFYHEAAYLDFQPPAEVRTICVSERQVPLADAISSYLFNSQLAMCGAELTLITPIECEQTPLVREYLKTRPFPKIVFVDVRQSMRNGGGPACLRLRVELTEEEAAAIHRGVIFDEALHAKLIAWVEKRYREEIKPEDLGDPKLLVESRDAIDELTAILGMPGVYDFQR